jgi:ATP-binding cassette, subfamily B, bacterial MsbA
LRMAPGTGSSEGAQARIMTAVDAGWRESSLKLLWRLICDYLTPYRLRLGTAMALMAMEAAATALLAWAFEPLLDKALKPGNSDFLWPFSLFILFIFTIRGLASYAHAVMVNRVGQHVVSAIQGRLYGHLIRADLAYLQTQASGNLLTRLVHDVAQMRMAVTDCVTGLVRHGLTLMALIGVMFYQDWFLGLIAFTVFPLSGWFLSHLGRKLRRIASRAQTALGSFASILADTLHGARQVKAYGMEAVEQTRVEAAIERLARLHIKSFKASAVILPVNEIFSGLAIVGVILYGGRGIAESGRTPGDLVSFIGAFMLAYQPMRALAKLNAQLQAGLAAAQHVLALLATKPAIVDRPGAVHLAPGRHGISLQGVCFAYEPGKPILHDINLVVAPGETVALVGASGAGKSAILNLLLRFYEPTAGRVMAGGWDVRDLSLVSLRASIALVSQETALFDDTIRANIAYGAPKADMASIEAVARAACAHDFIMSCPDGYDSLIGEGGNKLSGGQRQRLTIARAILRDAPILLLDEATSALDSGSERSIQEALSRFAQGRATLIVAHRLSAIAHADRIYVLEQGRIAEVGTHAALLTQGGLYSRYWRLQSASDVD